MPQAEAVPADALSGPGGPFEVEAVVLDGIPLRSFVRGPRTILDAFDMATAHRDATHLVFGDERYTFGEVRSRATNLAAHFRADFGIEAGDRVGIAMRNYPEFVIAFWATALAGGIIVPLNAWWTGAELRHAIDDAGLKVVVADDERLARLAPAGRRGTGPPGPILIRARHGEAGAVGPDEPAGLVQPVELADLVESGAGDRFVRAMIGPDDPVTILYTSGTTGRPKGAVGTSRGAIASILNMAYAGARAATLSGVASAPSGQAGQAASVAAAPLFHVGGVAAIISGAMFGSKMVLLPRWDAGEVVSLVEKERITNLGGVPTMARQLLDHPKLRDHDLSSLRTWTMGGAHVPPDLPRRVVEMFGTSVQILNGYGSTETTSAVVTNAGAEYAARPDSVGRPNLTSDIRVLDPAGEPLPEGVVGELCFRSPQVVKGYWNNPAATRESIVDGWCHTGDLGYVDEDGYVYVVDRLKDVVIRGGENVYCAEVESVLFSHPAVADAAVVGVPDRLLGERVGAVVVPRSGEELAIASLREHCLDHLAAFKCPEVLHVVDEIPKNATGKTAKHQLRRLVAEAHPQA